MNEDRKGRGSSESQREIHGLLRAINPADNDSVLLPIVQVTPALDRISAMAMSYQLAEFEDAKGSDVGWSPRLGITEHVVSFPASVAMFGASSVPGIALISGPRLVSRGLLVRAMPGCATASGA
jgi:hypothetical protein